MRLIRRKKLLCGICFKEVFILLSSCSYIEVTGSSDNGDDKLEAMSYVDQWLQNSCYDPNKSKLGADQSQRCQSLNRFFGFTPESPFGNKKLNADSTSTDSSDSDSVSVASSNVSASTGSSKTACEDDSFFDADGGR